MSLLPCCSFKVISLNEKNRQRSVFRFNLPVFNFIFVSSSVFFSRCALERRPHTFSSQTLFISIFYMDFTWTWNTNCDNEFPNLKCIPEPFFVEKTLGLSNNFLDLWILVSKVNGSWNEMTYREYYNCVTIAAKAMIRASFTAPGL